MPVKFSYSDLSETHDRLKREAQQYLDSLSGETTSFAVASSSVEDRQSNGDAALAPARNDISLDEGDPALFDPSCAISEASGSHRDDNSHSTTESEASDDDLPEMNFHQSSFNHSCGLSYNDDDSLLAMAQRLDDASVISYTSFEAPHHSHEFVEEDRRVLALPCSTNSLGDHTRRATKLNSKLERNAIAKKGTLEFDSTAAAKGRRRQKSHRQHKNHVGGVNSVDNHSLLLDSGENCPKIQPASSMEKHQVSKTKVDKGKRDGKNARDKRRDAKRGADNTQAQADNLHDTDRNKVNGHVAGQTVLANESKTTDGKKFYTVEKKNPPKISQWKDLDDVKRQAKNSKINEKKGPKSNQLNDSEYTIRTNNKTNNSKSRRSSFGKRLHITSPTTKKKSATIARKSQEDSDDESMHGVGCNVRLHGERDTEMKREPKSSSTQRSQSNSKTRGDSDPEARYARARSTPPTLKDDKPKTSLPIDRDDKSDDEVNSFYNSDCNTEFFYESTDDDGFFSQGEDDLPAVGTSVLKAVEDLNSKSAVCKMKNLLGIRG
ncbi:hypothetical protein HJC23_006267 [Cyclotella cryptica]|uniref:Uncharacterized protein n=1 Tax=Cyclotella cryptica TaxID=29204 RepID=A0ABD3PL54_9STRA|eukprot:CCRYP_013462-RA/>CCRYP_013462-RA protein AED:0.09 eAED:0.09 QI:0/-1/0/1/-1/1/1/0/548